MPHIYKKSNLIRRTQFVSGLKIKRKYLGLYRVSQVKDNDQYNVMKAFKNGRPEIMIDN